MPERPAVPKQIVVLDALPVTAIGRFFKPRLREMAAHQVIEDRLARHALSGTVAAQVLADSKGVQVIFDCGGNAAAAARVKNMMAPFALRWRIADHASAPQVGA